MTQTKHAAGRPYPVLRGRRLRNFMARIRNSTEFFSELHRRAGEAGLIEYWVLGQRFVVIFDPGMTEDVMLRQSDRFNKGKVYKRVLENPTIITGDGDDHRRRRKLYQPAFSLRARRGYHPHIVEEAKSMWDRLHDGETIDIDATSHELMLNIANRTFFGGDAAIEARLLKESLDTITWISIIGHLPFHKFFKALPLPGNIRYRRVLGELEVKIHEVVQKARQTSDERSDLVSWLATATDEEGVDSPFTEEEIRDEVHMLLLAGHETSASMLTWCLYYLSRYPETREKMEREVDEVLGGRLPEEEHLGKLVYTRAVFDEALRLSPPVAYLGRQAIEDVMINDYFIPKDTVVHLAIRIPMRQEQWFHDPDEFIPERWLEDPQPDRPRYAYAPFGGGVRLCSGLLLAVMEIVFSLAIFAQRWRVDPLSEGFPKVTDVVLYKVKHGLPVRVSSRPNPPPSVSA